MTRHQAHPQEKPLNFAGCFVSPTSSELDRSRTSYIQLRPLVHYSFSKERRKPYISSIHSLDMGSLIKPTVRIASASGSVTDRRQGFAELARDEDVSFIVGDWMSEYNMTSRGGAKVGSNAMSSEFEDCFLESINPALEHLAARRIKVAVNAGASDTKKLYDALVDEIAKKALDLKVAWIEGDEVFDAVQKAVAAGTAFRNLTTGRTFPPLEPKLLQMLILER